MSDLRLGASLLKDGYSVVIVKEGRVLAVERGPGVKPLITAALKAGHDICGSCLADKVVGVAVAHLVLYFGIDAVYGKTGSKEAVEVLARENRVYVIDEVVPYIMNRSRDGRCPIETLACESSSPKETYERLCQMFGIARPSSE